MSVEKISKIRPGISVDRGLWNRFTDFCSYLGVNHSHKLESMIDDLLTQDKRSPVEVERRKVLAELKRIEKKLVGLLDPKNKDYARYEKIIGWLTNRKPEHELGPFAEFAADEERINQFRLRAVDDYRKGAPWAKEDRYHLNITSELEIHSACEWYQEVLKCYREQRELTPRHNELCARAAAEEEAKVLRVKAAERARLVAPELEAKASEPTSSGVTS